MPTLSQAQVDELWDVTRHYKERWFGKAADQSGDNWAAETLDPYIVMSGGDEYGEATKLVGPADIDCSVAFRVGVVHVQAASEETPYMVRILFGDTVEEAISGDRWSSTVIGGPVEHAVGRSDVMMECVPVGTECWGQCWNAVDGATLDVFIGVRCYSR